MSRTRQQQHDDRTGTFKVRRIVGYRRRHAWPEFLVRWDGYDADADSWEPVENFEDDVADLLAEAWGGRRARPRVPREVDAAASLLALTARGGGGATR